MSESTSTGEDDQEPKGGEQKRSSGLSVEQQRKFEELRERRLHLKNAQDKINSRKKKRKRKRGKKGDDLQAAIEQQPPAAEERPIESAPPFASEQSAPTFASGQRHIFTLNTGKGTATGGGGLPVAPCGRGAGGAEEGTAIVPSTLMQNPSGVMALVPAAKTLEVPQKKAKRKKLHWGMEIKERWERKGNM